MGKNNTLSEKDVLRKYSVFFFSEAFFSSVGGKVPAAKLADWETFRQHTSIETAIFELTLANTLCDKLAVHEDGLSPSQYNWYGDRPKEHSSDCVVPAALKTEFQVSIGPFVGSEKYLTMANRYLYGYEDEDDCEVECVSSIFELSQREPAEKKYRLVNSASNLYIIVEEGFLKELQESVSSKKDFYVDVLKALYAMDRINNVNQSAWYRQYLEVLSTTV
jgi:hypothetical protein